MKPKYDMIKRDHFIKARYENYLKTKAYLDSIDPDRQWSYLTDLDRTYDGEVKQQKDIILCDSCNDDIDDFELVFLEEQNVYHVNCIKDRDWFEPKPTLAYDNVIPLFKRKDGL